MTTVEALQELYVNLGGDLTDKYDSDPVIAGGVPVEDYTTIPDMIYAIAQLDISSDGGGGET